MPFSVHDNVDHPVSLYIFTKANIEGKSIQINNMGDIINLSEDYFKSICLNDAILVDIKRGF